MRSLLFAAFLLSLGAGEVDAQTRKTKDRAPTGIAARYPGDVGIETDSAVLFADGFEGGDVKRWDEDQAQGDTARVAVTTDPKLAFFGQHAVQMTATRGKNNGGGLIKWLGKGCDELYARFYVKLAKDAGYIHHFVHVNGAVDRWGSFGKAGLLPAGDHHFTTGIEPTSSWGKHPPPGKWFFYTYWHEMQASPDGKYWGNGFHPTAEVVRRGEWVCMEVRVSLNTPGKSDGSQAVWQDGRQIGEFGGINWRTSAKLKANVFWLMTYVTEKAFAETERHAPKHRASANTRTHTVWFDQVVVATSYVGPLVAKKTPKKKRR